MQFASSDINYALKQSHSTFERVTSSIFSLKSLIVLCVVVAIAYVVGRLAATILRRITNGLARQADKTHDLSKVRSLRRLETLTVLSIAIIRTLFIAIAIYFWWIYIHPTQQPTALLGASAVIAIVIGGALSPVLRDLASGSVMMAEHWFGVGDLIKVEPFVDLQGVVERVTLRSTRIRGLNGEVIWINNQNMQAVRITPKGSRTVALELFISDIDQANQLIELVNTRLPTGALMVVSPLAVMTAVAVSSDTWHITAIGEAAPGREWLLEEYAVTLLRDIDAVKHKTPILLHTPIARYADSESEIKFARSINNARKVPAKRRTLKERTKPRRQTE